MPYLSTAFDVTIIDCANWVRVAMIDLIYKRLRYSKLVTVMGEADFKSVIAELRPMYAIDFTGSGPHIRPIQNILRRANAKYVVQRITPSPLPNGRPGTRPASFAQSISVIRRGFRWMLRAMTNRNPLPPDIALVAGSRAIDHWTSSSKTILWTGSTDYFTLKNMQQTRSRGDEQRVKQKERYALFIDDCLSLSMDYEMTGQSRPIEPDEYFGLLLQAFSNIEKRLSMPIVIAAHPSGRDMPQYASLFGGRTVHFNATAELSLDCEIAMTHFSTAVAFPVLLRKPIVILHAQTLRNTHQGRFIDNLHQLLRCPVLFMDAHEPGCENGIAQSVSVNEEAYDEYVKNYIINTTSSDTNPFQPFVRFATGC
jgi:hypothetical protein